MGREKGWTGVGKRAGVNSVKTHCIHVGDCQTINYEEYTNLKD